MKWPYKLSSNFLAILEHQGRSIRNFEAAIFCYTFLCYLPHAYHVEAQPLSNSCCSIDLHAR